MDNNFKRISKQIEKDKKSQVNLIKVYLENSRANMDSIGNVCVNQANVIASVNLAIESLKNSRAIIDGIGNVCVNQANVIASVNLVIESLKNNMFTIDNIRATYGIPTEFVSTLSLNNNLNAITNVVHDINVLKYASIIDFINNLDLNLIAQKYENKFFGKYTKEFDLFIRNNGWLIPNCASEDFIDSLRLSFVNNQNIDKKFVEYFSDDDFRVVSRLKEKWDLDGVIPKGTLKIIFNVITLILNDNGHKYPDIIIPPLIAQIDILISEVLLKNGFHEENRKFSNDHYDSKGKGNIRTFREDFAENIIDDWEEHHVNFLLENLFANNYGSELQKSLILNFNRHDIMHGSDNEYGTFENVIRCLLLIDFLNDFLSDDADYRLN